MFLAFWFYSRKLDRVIRRWLFPENTNKMTNRQLSLKFDKWYKLRDKYDFDYTILVCSENNLKFCDTFKNNKMRYFIGTGLLIIDFALIVLSGLEKKNNIVYR